MKNLLVAGLIPAALLAGIVTTAGCSSFDYHGETVVKREPLRVTLALLPPADNATDDEHAGRAVTELIGSALYERGVPVHQTEYSRMRLNDPKASGPDGRYAGVGATSSASHLVLATVHEYRYKTDLDGDPAVAVTIRVVDAKTGATVWQGSAGNVGYTFASLSSSAQYVVRKLIADIPLAKLEKSAATAPVTTPAPAAPAKTPAAKSAGISDDVQKGSSDPVRH